MSWRRACEPVEPIAPGSVTIWRLPLDLDEAALAPLLATLTDAERARAARFHFDQHRHRFTAARGQLRAILGRYLDCPPQCVAFRHGPNGKPAIAGECGGLEFNLSHSGGFGLVALTRDRPLGVDLEHVRAMRDFEGIAQRFFAPEEVADLVALAPDERPEAFFRIWTRKEAYVKADGAGLTHALDRFRVSVHPAQPARLLHIDGSTEAAVAWSLVHLDPSPGYLGCLAVRGPISVLRLLIVAAGSM